MREKEDEKGVMYQDLVKGRSKNVAGVRTKVAPVAVGALRSMPLRLNDNLRTFGVGIFLI